MPEPDLRSDYAPWFERWDSVLHYPNPAPGKPKLQIHGFSGGLGSIPCYQHKTCKGLVLLGAFGLGKYPPRVCPECKIDTATEVRDGQGAVEFPSAD